MSFSQTSDPRAVRYDSAEFDELFGCLEEDLGEDRARYYTVDGGTGSTWRSMLIARDPLDALHWICAGNDIRTIRMQIDAWYTNNHSEDIETSERVQEPANGETLDATDRLDRDLVHTKRRRGKAGEDAGLTSRQLKKKKEVEALQHWNNLWPGEINPAITLERQKFLQYFEAYPLIKQSIVDRMITTASSITTTCMLDDWVVIMRAWRRRVVTETVPLLTTQALLQQSSNLDYTSDRQLYFGILQHEGNTLVASITRRVMLSKWYEQSVLPSDAILGQSSCASSGRRGVSVASVRKTTLFQRYYGEELGNSCNKDTNPEAWTEMTRMISYGKRWHTLQKTLGGIGIFAVLPSQFVSNSFVERELLSNQVAIWAQSIRTCVPGITDIIENAGRVLSCYLEKQAPPESLCLEHMDLEQKYPSSAFGYAFLSADHQFGDPQTGSQITLRPTMPHPRQTGEPSSSVVSILNALADQEGDPELPPNLSSTISNTPAPSLQGLTQFFTRSY